jgi:hypothetical protein
MSIQSLDHRHYPLHTHGYTHTSRTPTPSHLEPYTLHPTQPENQELSPKHAANTAHNDMRGHTSGLARWEAGGVRGFGFRVSGFGFGRGLVLERTGSIDTIESLERKRRNGLGCHGRAGRLAAPVR